MSTTSNIPRPAPRDLAHNADDDSAADSATPDSNTTGPHQSPDKIAPDPNTTGPHQGE